MGVSSRWRRPQLCPEVRCLPRPAGGIARDPRQAFPFLGDAVRESKDRVSRWTVESSRRLVGCVYDRCERAERDRRRRGGRMPGALSQPLLLRLTPHDIACREGVLTLPGAFTSVANDRHKRGLRPPQKRRTKTQQRPTRVCSQGLWGTRSNQHTPDPSSSALSSALLPSPPHPHTPPHPRSPRPHQSCLRRHPSRRRRWSMCAHQRHRSPRCRCRRCRSPFVGPPCGAGHPVAAPLRGHVARPTVDRLPFLPQARKGRVVPIVRRVVVIDDDTGGRLCAASGDVDTAA